MDTKQIVTTYYEKYAAHDLDGVLALMDEEIHIYFPIDEQPKVGKEKIRKTWELSWNTIIPDIRPEVHAIIAERNRAAVQFTETGTVHIPEEAAKQLGLEVVGRSYSNECGSFFILSDEGLITEIRSYWDTGKYAKQLGIDISIIQNMSSRASS